LFLARSYPLPRESDYSEDTDVGPGLHNDTSFPIHLGQATCLNGGPGIIVAMIFIAAPQSGQAIWGRFLAAPNILKAGRRSTICKKRMSLLLHGWRKP